MASEFDVELLELVGLQPLSRRKSYGQIYPLVRNLILTSD